MDDSDSSLSTLSSSFTHLLQLCRSDELLVKIRLRGASSSPGLEEGPEAGQWWLVGVGWRARRRQRRRPERQGRVTISGGWRPGAGVRSLVLLAAVTTEAVGAMSSGGQHRSGVGMFSTRAAAHCHLADAAKNQHSSTQIEPQSLPPSFFPHTGDGAEIRLFVFG